MSDPNSFFAFTAINLIMSLWSDLYSVKEL